MAITTKPLVTLEDLKCHLPVRKGNVDFDDLLRSYINLATTQIEQATKRHFTEQEFFATFASRNTSRIVLDLIGEGRTTVQTQVEDYHRSGTSVVTRVQTLTLPSAIIFCALPISE